MIIYIKVSTVFIWIIILSNLEINVVINYLMNIQKNYNINIIDINVLIYYQWKNNFIFILHVLIYLQKNLFLTKKVKHV